MTGQAGDLPARQSDNAILLELALQAGATGTWRYDTAAQRLHLDAAEFRLFGLDPERFGGTLEEALDRIHDDDRPRVEVALRNAIASGGTFDQEFRVNLPDGTVRWLSGLGRPGDGNSFIGVTSDKTAQPSAVMALADSERRLRLASEAAKLGSFDFDAASKTLILDQRAQAILRCKSSVISLDDWFALMHPDDHAAMHAFAARALDPSDALDQGAAEYRIVLPTSDIVWIEGRCLVLFSGQGADRTPRRVIGTVQDVTQRKRREMELAAATETLDLLFASAPIGLAFCDQDLRYKRINATLAEINGLPIEDHIGKSIEEVLPELATKDLVDRYRRVIESGKPSLNVEVMGKTPASPDEVRCWNESIVTISVDGTLIGCAAFVEDKTEQKKWDAQRELLIRELNHRVKNTLTLVQSIANSSLRLAASPSAFVDAFSGRLEALARAHDMIVEANWQRIDLATLIETQAMIGCASEEGRMVLKGPPVALNNSDGVMFGLAIHELATNAQKYGSLSTPDGRVDVSWEVSTTDKGPEIRLTWQERGGPTVKPPAGEGFGFTMVQTAIGKYGGGEAAFDFDPAGLRCRLRFPVEPE